MAGGVRVEFDFFGERQVNRRITGIELRAVDASPAFRYMADFLRGVERRQFLSAGSFGGSPWAPLQASTIAAKVAKGSRHANQILRDTDAMFRSVTRKGDANQVLRVSSDVMTFGTDVEYAQYHQGGRGVPRRPLFNLTQAHRAEIVRILQGWIVAGRLNAGVFR